LFLKIIEIRPFSELDNLISFYGYLAICKQFNPEQHT